MNNITKSVAIDDFSRIGTFFYYIDTTKRNIGKLRNASYDQSKKVQKACKH